MLVPESTKALMTYLYNSVDEDTMNVHSWVETGSIDAHVMHADDQNPDFNISTPTAVCSVKGTDFSVVYHGDDTKSIITVSDGVVRIVPEFNTANSLLLNPWNKVTVSDNTFGEITPITLSRIEIFPDTATVYANRKTIFSCIGFTDEGDRVSLTVTWASAGGSFDNSSGLFHAGISPGEYTVTATEPVHGLTATGTVIIIGKPVGIPEISEMKTDETLSQNFPNPFHSSTTIQFFLNQDERVILKVFNHLGEEVALLVNESKPAGGHSVEFDGKNLESGLYFYKILSGANVSVRKMLLIR
jgi:hypothetical protein